MYAIQPAELIHAEPVDMVLPQDVAFPPGQGLKCLAKGVAKLRSVQIPEVLELGVIGRWPHSLNGGDHNL